MRRDYSHRKGQFAQTPTRFADISHRKERRELHGLRLMDQAKEHGSQSVIRSSRLPGLDRDATSNVVLVNGGDKACRVCELFADEECDNFFKIAGHETE